MTPTLALRCDIQRDETVPSWVSRLAVLNSAETARAFCLDMGLTFRACVAGRPSALVKLSALTGVALPVLERACFRSESPYFILRGERFAQNTLRRTQVCICPQCIHDDWQASGANPSEPYGRIAWQISGIRTCPHHRCALSVIAANTGRSTDDFAFQLDGRRRQIEQLAKSAAPRQPSALEIYVADRLDQRPTGAAWLDGLEMQVAITSCELLGTLITRGADARPMTLSDDDLHCAGDAGFRIASGGEPAIRQALDRVARLHPYTRSGRQGPGAVYGQFYRSLVVNKRSVAYEPVRDVLRRHIIETTPVGPGDVVIHQTIDKRVVHSITTAAHETGRNPVRLRKMLAAAGLIPADHKKFSNHHVTFKVEGAERFLASYKDGLTLKDVAAYLDISRDQVRSLAANGYIRPRAEHRGQRNDRLPTYARDDLDDFLARLLDKAKPIQNPQDPCYTIAAAARHLRCSTAEIIRFIVGGQLAWVGKDVACQSYNSVIVDTSEVRNLLRGPKTRDVVVGRAKTLLSTTKYVVDALIREAYLTRRTAMDPVRNQWVELIKAEDIDRFNKTYISVYQLSKLKGVHSFHVIRALANVEPAIDKGRVGATFYRRDSLPEF
ncbi:TniQ family protein [Methylobacterium sp. E-005]|uniref:TniQ family protein n=1 Tax=Methylobacterium sp. E-005 TaxID=2836549 RepID=UPI001FBA0E80|nr:TniQ family protein [Methylobacterium sp. E-005]MCJ2089816.1 TniQ family protein [Methylobacterium sp. E-005]